MKKIYISFAEIVVIGLLYGIIFLSNLILGAIMFDGWSLIFMMLFNIVWFFIIVPKVIFKIYDKQKKFKFILK